MATILDSATTTELRWYKAVVLDVLYRAIGTARGIGDPDDATERSLRTLCKCLGCSLFTLAPPAVFGTRVHGPILKRLLQDLNLVPSNQSSIKVTTTLIIIIPNPHTRTLSPHPYP